MVAQSTTTHDVQHQSKSRTKPIIRAIVTLSLMLTWASVAITGFMLEFGGRHGPPAGEFERTREAVTTSLFSGHMLGEMHFWLAIVALVITFVHIALDWKMFTANLRNIFKSR
jgi:hypothetical protein